MTRLEVVRDPLWNNIQLEPAALELLDTPAVQRLRYVRQLGHAFLVYPGATHTRFEHALGAYVAKRSRQLIVMGIVTGQPIVVDINLQLAFAQSRAVEMRQIVNRGARGVHCRLVYEVYLSE